MEYNGHGHGFMDSNINPFGLMNDEFEQNTLFATTSTSTFLQTSPLSQNSSSFEDLSFIFDQQALDPFAVHHYDYDYDYDPNIKLESWPLLSPMVEDNCHFDVPNPKAEPKKNGKGCKVEGQPSKNLMAERRRRKRLNDRLSMLRSVVPKISKMDRTSILGDTIDYMKELMEKINHMQQEMDKKPKPKPKEVFIRNSPKFDVERRSRDTCVEVCCTGKPELLISTMSTLEALGLEIHQCVISCFSDFLMHASCSHSHSHSQDTEQRVILNSDDIKQALFRNAGYGGKCL